MLEQTDEHPRGWGKGVCNTPLHAVTQDTDVVSFDVSTFFVSTAELLATERKKPMSHRKETSKRVALSFFSGAMGMDQGLEKAGFDVRLVCESDLHCQNTIRLNRPQLPVLEDIRRYSPQDILKIANLPSGEIDLIVGGPPCQAFSTAGKRNGFEDERGNVFLTFLDLIFALQPKYFVIENVRGLLSSPLKHRPHDLRGKGFSDLSCDEMAGGALHFILAWIESKGYTYSFDLYNTANFGTPQVRERVVLIGSKEKKKPPYLITTHAKDAEQGLLPWRTFRQATADLQTHTYVPFPQKRLKYFALLKEGQNWRSLPAEIQKEALGNAYHSGGGKTGFFRRLAWDKPSPTLLTHPAMQATALAHPEEPRPLSIEEYKRLQEFPDDWTLSGGLMEQYKQVGNAVPVGFGYAIGKHLLQLLNGEEITQPETQDRLSRYTKTNDVEWKSHFEKARNHLQKQEPTLDLFGWASNAP